ncbi:MFS transporter [Luteimicrobium subarcticum]|uniref:Putative MFS family arabinose efflux permease n=1 Tax=Luteimicrobium subarcticum TaxID=620910 RepID=A0A2M8WST9_9MICO|nr:MFS transporter [Luteimicrobium subarcticum]PJI94012.1 putative MFS family arabinose efflux permease [Luteimicrobium subarcticum]
MSTFDSLRFRNYRLWFAGALVANVGTWMQRVAQDWLVLTHLSHDSSFAVGIVTALQFLPFLLMAPVGGLLADRVDRRKLLMTTQAAMGALALGLGTLVLTGTVQLWHVYAFALALGVVATIDAPVRQTFVSQLVPADRLSNAVGLNSASFNAARLIGPGVAGLLIAAVGAGWVFVINGVSFAATILALLLMRVRDLRPMPVARRGRGQVREGFRYVRGRSDILVIMVVVGVVSMFGLNFQLTSATMARTVFDKGAGEYGVLGSILAIGSLAGALLAARRKQPRVRLVVGAAFAFGLAAGALALAPSYLMFAVLCIPVGLASLTMMTAANATIQMSTEPEMRGRVMAVYMMVFQGATPIGSPIVGWIGQQLGARWSIGIGSVTALLVSVGAYVWMKRHWHVQVRYRVAARPHLVVRHLDADAGRTVAGPLAPAQRAAAARELEAAEEHARSSAA